MAIAHWEYKFVFRDNRMAQGMFNLISGLKEFAGYGCRLKSEEKILNRHYYFDSPDLRLESQGVVCRVRRSEKGKSCSLVIKRQTLGPNREVVYPQTDPIPLGTDGLFLILEGKFPANVGPLLTLFAGSAPLEHVLSLEVSRNLVEIVGRGGVIAVLNLDHIKAILPESEEVVAEDYEIELKSDREQFPEADQLKDFLCNAFGMIPITRSKLRRMARLIRHKRDGGARKVILDMDTGVDDALALLLAMQSPELDILGVTVVGGNVEVDQTARNTAAVLTHIYPFVKTRYPRLPFVAKGEKRPVDRPTAVDVHGPDGLGGVSSKYFTEEAERLIGDNAHKFFVALINNHPPSSVTLVTTGPLTNPGHWIQPSPESVKRLHSIVCMGGVFFQAGNRSQTAEFNIHFDPFSARNVVEFCRKPLSSSPGQWHETIPLTFVGLDVTHQVRLRRGILEDALKQNPHDKRLELIREITRYYMDFYNRNEGLDGCYLHDPLAVAYAIDPSFCQAEQYHVEVEDIGEFTSGMTVADYRPTRLFKDRMKEMTWVCYKVDAERFERVFLERVLK